MNKKLIMLFTMSFISMQVMAMDSNPKGLENEIPQHILEMCEKIESGELKVPESQLCSLGGEYILESFIDDADNKIIILGGLMGSESEHRDSRLNIPNIGYLFARSKGCTSCDKPRIVRLNTEMHPTIIAPQQEDKDTK